MPRLLSASIIAAAIAVASLLGACVYLLFQTREAVKFDLQVLGSDLRKASAEHSRTLEILNARIAELVKAVNSLNVAGESSFSTVDDADDADQETPSRSRIAGAADPAEVSETTTGKRVVQELGNEVLALSRQVMRLQYGEFLKFLSDKAGIPIGTTDMEAEHVVQHLRGRYRARLDLLKAEQNLLVAKLRQELKRQGRYEEAPLDQQFPPLQRDPEHLVIQTGVTDTNAQKHWRYQISAAEFPEILAHDEAVKDEFAQLVDDVEGFLSERAAGAAGK